jgi:hypothetical protein
MKEQIKPSTRAHLIPSLFILLSLATIGVIPFAHAQRNATKAMAAGPGAAATKLSASKPVITDSAARVFRMDAPPAPAAPQVVLYDQYNNVAAGTPTVSATFTDFPTFSADLADDFVVPSGQTWTVMSIDADGAYFNGSGPANSWNVYIHADAGGVPGAIVASTLNTTVSVSGTTYTVTFSPAAVLTAGTYWVEIQANMTFSSGGEWGWTDRTVQCGNPAAWQNPGGGFGICPTWMPKLATCVTTAGGPDQVYRLNGTTTGGTGTCAVTPTPPPCPIISTYFTTVVPGTIVPGTTDTGSHCDNCATAVPLPFPVNLYGALYNIVNVSSNGSVDFVGSQAPATHGCQALPKTLWTTAILPYQGDLRTDNGPWTGCNAFPGAQCGIFTSVTGTAPNRQFHIEWRATHFADTTTSANFEVRLNEGCSNHFEIVYGATNDSGSDETSGVQATSSGPATTFSCGGATLTNGLDVTYSSATTPTPPPTPSPCGSWFNTTASYPITDVRYGFAQANVGGTNYFYVFGGVSNGTRVNNVNRYNLTTGLWEARAPMPFTSEAPTCALMASTGIVYCAEGDTGTHFSSYNLATDTWTTLANTPNSTDDYGSASGAFNGEVFLVGGTTSFVSNVWVYDVAGNTWAPGTVAPDPFLLAGYQQVGQYLYLTGGWTGGGPTGLTTTRRLDMTSAPGTWSNGPAFTYGRSDFGLAYDPRTDKLYALGGDLQGGGFFDSTNEVDELDIKVWPGGVWQASPSNLPAPNHQANQAGFNGDGLIWSTGGIDGTTFTFLSDHLFRQNVCGPTLVSAVSRVTHSGGCGTFDIALPGIEPRSTGGNYTIVVVFSANETVTSASVTCHNPGSGTGTTGAVSGSGTPVITVPLTGVSNAQTLTVRINGTTSVDIPMTILIGDTNSNGTVNAADIAQTKGRLGQTVTAANFRSDVNANCAINAADVAIIKQNSGTSAPLTCP